MSFGAEPLLGFFVSGVLIAVGAELVQFQPCCCVTAILHRSVSRHPIRSLVGVRTTLRTFQRNNNSDAFALSHISLDSLPGDT